MNSITSDSTKLLTEKLALSREVAVLKPEVEHLRSQLAHQKDVLAEKLALERQLNALEVELANEKRAAQRVTQSATRSQASNDDITINNNNDNIVDDLRQRVCDLEKKLASEKRESQRAKKTLEAELAEARGQIELFEQRMDDLKAKLRDVREELKGAHAELSTSRDKQQQPSAQPAARASAVPKETTRTKVTKVATKTQASQAQRKRRAEEPSGPEPILETPGVANEGRKKRPLKKRGIDLAKASEKSAFSITPFLSKTANAIDGSPTAAEDKSKTAKGSAMQTDQSVTDNATASVADSTAAATEDKSELPEDSIMGRRVSASAMLSSVDVGESVEPTAAPVKEDEAPKRRGRPLKEKAVLREASLSKKNMPAPLLAASGESSLGKTTVASAADEPASEKENQQPTVPLAKEKKGVSEAEPKKKKRKILGAASKTVFDEDEDDGGIKDDDGVLARPGKTVTVAGAVAVKRASVKTLSIGRAAGGGSTKRAMLGGGTKNAFGAASGGFSPLKRHKRGVNASFLA